MPRILLIEDNETNCDLITRYLEYLECEVLHESDGLLGFQRAQRDRDNIDVILLDMNLPTLDGYEVAGRLKADTGTASIPVIALTAHAMVGDRERALAAGCDDYATKPINFQTLIEKIQAFSRRGFPA